MELLVKIVIQFAHLALALDQITAMAAFKDII